MSYVVNNKTFELSTDSLKRLATEGGIIVSDDELVIRVHRGNMDGTIGALAAGHVVAIKNTDYSLKY